jgi:hypothetical protein
MVRKDDPARLNPETEKGSRIYDKQVRYQLRKKLRQMKAAAKVAR